MCRILYIYFFPITQRTYCWHQGCLKLPPPQKIMVHEVIRFILQITIHGWYTYLVGSNQMNNNASVAEVYQPVGVVESKSGQQVAWGIISKSCVPSTSHRHVEYGGGNDTKQTSPLHCFVFRGRRFQGVLIRKMECNVMHMRWEWEQNQCINIAPPNLNSLSEDLRRGLIYLLFVLKFKNRGYKLQQGTKIKLQYN